MQWFFCTIRGDFEFRLSNGETVSRVFKINAQPEPPGSQMLRPVLACNEKLGGGSRGKTFRSHLCSYLVSLRGS